MFANSAKLYDTLYAALGKDYVAESGAVHRLIQELKRSPGNRLLDVACGSGAHLERLQAHYKVEGLDLDPALLAVARKKLPDVPFHQGDMVDLNLGSRFDAVTCLFGSIGYVETPERMRQAIAAMARHLTPGGVLLVEPWIRPEDWREGHVGSVLVEEAERKVARMSVSGLEGRVSVLEFHYLVGTPGKVEHRVEQHRLGLFRAGEYQDAFELAGLEAVFDNEGLMGRGLYVCAKPIA